MAASFFLQEVDINVGVAVRAGLQGKVVVVD